MNETVAKIVELLFQDVEMNDEVKAIHDEVMNNCQERFGDLLNRGLNEDEAIAAVVESLKGMEEVLAGYPRRKAQEERAPEQGFRVQNAVLSGDGGQAAFSAQGLRSVSVSMQGEDLTIEPSPDDEVHVICHLGESDEHQVMVTAEMVNGELRVRRDKGERSNGKVKDFHINGEDISFSVKNLSFDSLGDLLSKLMRNLKVNFDSNGRVCVQVPAWVHLERVQVQTNSGDVGMDGLTTDVLDISSRSGDLRVELPGGHRLERVGLHTTSGDVEAWLTADRAVLQSMSGDMRYVGVARVLEASSTSGDVTVEMNAGVCEQCKVRSVSGDVECTGVVRQMSAGTTSGDVELNIQSETVGFSSVSGDVDMKLEGDLREIEGHTTSGDVTVNLPADVREAEVRFHTVSGYVNQSIASVGGAPLRITMNTVSGNINIR